MSEPVKIVIDREGGARHLLDESGRLDEIYDSVGAVDQTWRNSHVESASSLSEAAVREAAKWYAGPLTRDGQPDRGDPAQRLTLDELRALLPGNMWWADMQPVGGPVLGPFEKHAQALEAEIQWLRRHSLPLPVADLPCRVPRTED